MNRVFKALADPTRRRVLQLLRERPMSAGELSAHFDVSKPTMSAHFSVLHVAGLVEAEKSGRTIVYRLKMSVLEDALLAFAQTLGWNITPERAGDAGLREIKIRESRESKASKENREHKEKNESREMRELKPIKGTKGKKRRLLEREA